MTILRNRNVAVKIAIIVGSMIFFTLTIGVVGFLAATQIAKMAEEMYSERLLPVQLVDQVRLLSKDTQASLLELIATPEPERQQVLLQTIEKNTEMIDRLQEEYATTGLDEVEQRNWDELRNNLGEYRSARAQIIELVRQNRNREAFELYRNSKAAIADITQPRDAISDYNVKQAEKLYKESTAAAANTHRIIAIATVAAIILSLVLGIMLVRAICLPLFQMLASVRKIAAGKWDEPSDDFSSNDELGQLAAGIAAMRGGLRSLLEETASQTRALEQEIAERQQVQAALAFSKDKFTKAFRHAGDAVGLVSLKERRFVEISDAFFDNLGYERSQVIGRVSTDFDLWNDLQQRACVYERMTKHEKIQNEEAVWKTASGVRRTGLFSAEVIEVEGNEYSVFVWRDISEQKRAEEVLRRANEELEENVKQRTLELTGMNSELRQTNEELVQSLTRVKEMQDQLIEAEKMTALSSLVTGIAHEINTPVGVGVTAASHLLKTIRDYRGQAASGKLTRGSFAEFMGSAEEMGEMILQNLSRTAELIRSFKLVAVDQSQEEKQCFQLKEYLDGVVHSLQSVLKKNGHTITLECPEELLIDSYPGAFVQIATNLLMNSLIHAYEPGVSGHIRLQVKRHTNRMIVTYADDGKGIDANVLPKIFEPFFTTQRGKGCSGLGMHIVYNLVTQQLQGSVVCESQAGQGVRFVIDVPLEGETK